MTTSGVLGHGLPESKLPPFAQAALTALRQPFPMAAVRVRPGATEGDVPEARALIYAEWWTGYVPRLQRELGAHNWSITLEGWSSNKVFARLRAFGGLIDHTASGESDVGEAYEGASAEAQAKKRACAEALGLGLYFYFLPPIYGKVERPGGRLVFPCAEQDRIIRTLYAAIPDIWPAMWGDHPPPLQLEDLAPPGGTYVPVPEDVVLATDAQLGFLVMLAQGHPNRRHVQTLGELVGVPHLADVRDPASLRGARLSADTAATIISGLRTS
ncbi:MAG TPA: hypothetical protein VNN10_11215 [Dehalococcoidia bacterium]|nr:hypothetical protein [Dehalococcoidia bacterium]